MKVAVWAETQDAPESVATRRQCRQNGDRSVLKGRHDEVAAFDDAVGDFLRECGVALGLDSADFHGGDPSAIPGVEIRPT